MIDEKEWKIEKTYLYKVMREIKAQIEIGENAADNYKKDAIELQKSMWEDVRCAPSGLSDLEDAAQINQIQMDLSNKASLYRFSYEKVSKLKRMQDNPYFGRIDFLENGEKTLDNIYIGISNLNANDTMDILVYDWRAPVSGMFYDFEIGPSSYACPAGLIEGELLLKRQYKIENSEIAYMFDSSISINDAMLQEILGKNTDNRMKTIVTSIQKEQNTVIRNDKDRILIVEGPAGSGKTSIALHRAAYLLYKYRETIKSENILIFSPNHVFEDYISHVLPELGEENIRRSTFADFFGKAFLADKQKETVNQQMEYILNAEPDDIRIDSIRFKASPLFLTALKRCVQFLESGAALKLKGLVYDKTLLISADKIDKLYKSQYDRLPYANRLERIREKLLGLLEGYETKRFKEALEKAPKAPATRPELRAEFELRRNEIMQMTVFSVYPLYINLFKNIERFVQPADKQEAARCRRIAEYTVRELEQGIIDYEDLAPIVYLDAVLEAENSAGSVKHIIIDEAQDYTPVQYEIFKSVFRNCSMTILGDINQTVNGYMNIGSFEAAADIFSTMGQRAIVLTKSYRSSKEIADFCSKILVSPNASEQLNRHGSKPKAVKVSSDSLYNRLAGDITDLKDRGYKLIAVICKTASQCKAVHRGVSQYIDIGLVSNQNEVYRGDCFVIPSYLAKGLEFDAVLVSTADEIDYYLPEDRKLLYTVCTRALHELYLYYFDNITSFIAGIDKELYNDMQK